MRLRRLAEAAFESAMEANLRTIEGALGALRPVGQLLDLGCDDGVRTASFGRAAGAAVVHGVDAVAKRVQLARDRGIEAVQADLEHALPYKSGSFDAIVSNQVIEHLRDTDAFVAELRRLLRPGGHAVVSTENLASWHNVAALALGWQPFSLTNVSEVETSIGNPAGLHRGAMQERPREWQHVRVFAYRGLRELFEAHGLAVEAVLGAGYYPLPARVGGLDPRHAAFLTLVARKPPG